MPGRRSWPRELLANPKRHFVDYLLYLIACVVLWMQIFSCDCMWYSLLCELCTRPPTTSKQVYYCVLSHMLFLLTFLSLPATDKISVTKR